MRYRNIPKLFTLLPSPRTKADLVLKFDLLSNRIQALTELGETDGNEAFEVTILAALHKNQDDQTEFAWIQMSLESATSYMHPPH